jgi:thiol-disulfide isomerase/thioredoxin
MMIQLETDSLNHFVRVNPQGLMVMFGTDWCGNCDILKPEFLKLSQQKENREILFVFVNPDDFPISRDMIDLTNIPMMLLSKKERQLQMSMGIKKK